MTGQAMLTLTDVRKSFGATRAVDGLTLEIRRGEVFGFLGPNGAGKTTTISMLVGLIRPDSGTIVIDGAGSPDDPRTRAAIGVAPQAIALYDELTASENLSFFASLYGLQGRARASRVVELIELVGLADRGRERLGGYSGGMKRRLNFAAALLHDPQIVLLDEPTAGVDPQSRNAILGSRASNPRDKAAPSSTRRITWRRRRSCAIAWRSSITGGSWTSTRWTGSSRSTRARAS